MPGNADRRPWLIISAAEGQALLDVALAQPRPSEDLSRAIRILNNQLRWLHDGRGERPTAQAAAKRDMHAA